jgi:hypothetical protein
MPAVACSAHTPRKQTSAVMREYASIACAPTHTIARASSVPPITTTSRPASAVATGGLCVMKVPV